MMKNLNVIFMLMTSIFSLIGCNNANDPSDWSTKKTDRWFEKGEWLNGWSVLPDPSVNRKAFAVAYYKNKERWNTAFTFLGKNDLTKLEVRRYDLDDDNLYLLVTDYMSKNEENTRPEAHRKYIDIQYVISGNELIGLAPISAQTSVLEPYDTLKDIEFISVGMEKKLKATPDKFFIFFPGDAHRPGIKKDENSPVRKLVVKIKID
jgi:YhcH/YjgK/YiaL family protein